MTFEFDFILVGLMQIFGFFVQLSPRRLRTDFWEPRRGYHTELSSQFHSYTIWA